MRDFKILQFLVLTISATLPLAESLSGPHVCTRVENHTFTIRETYTEPVIVQTFTWCLQAVPRCSKTRIDNRERYRIKTTTKERKITECCDGYVLQKLHPDSDQDPKCIPFCKSCQNGYCLKPNICKCKPGYQGDNCAHVCPAGSWGRECMEECDCASGESCNPVSGICECPAGWQGVGCKLPCNKGRWGLRCESICECNGKHAAACNPETGDCQIGKYGDAEVSLSRNSTGRDLFKAFQVTGLVVHTSPSTNPLTIVGKGTETTDSNIEDGLWTRDFTDFSVTKISWTTEHAREDRSQIISEAPIELDGVKPEFPIPDLAESISTTSLDDLTQFEDIVSQPTPEIQRPITPGSAGELFYRNDENNNDVESGIKTVGQPHPSYVKTVQKEQVPQIPYDTTILIVVGSVVSLCLTTLAVLMVFYLRSKVFESIPMSIYSNGKIEGGQEKGNTIRSLNITNTTLPPLPTFVNPVFAANPENALITFDATELNKHYDNRTGTISIRVSGNIRDLLESHYDRPPAATCRHTMQEQNTEHVYDEIPLTAPLCVRKEA